LEILTTNNQPLISTQEAIQPKRPRDGFSSPQLANKMSFQRSLHL